MPLVIGVLKAGDDGLLRVYEVGEFLLIRSTLGRNGPVYDELAAYPLGGGNGA